MTAWGKVCHFDQRKKSTNATNLKKHQPPPTRIKTFDKQIEQICRERYPETELLRAIKGVGALTALAYTLIIEDSDRFSKGRKVGCFVRSGLLAKPTIEVSLRSLS